MLLSIKMITATSTTLDAPATDVVADPKVSASDANLPSGPVVKTVEEGKAGDDKGLLAVMYQEQVAPANGQAAGSVKKPEI